MPINAWILGMLLFVCNYGVSAQISFEVVSRFRAWFRSCCYHLMSLLEAQARGGNCLKGAEPTFLSGAPGERPGAGWAELLRHLSRQASGGPEQQ